MSWTEETPSASSLSPEHPLTFLAAETGHILADEDGDGILVESSQSDTAVFDDATAANFSLETPTNSNWALESVHSANWSEETP